MTTNRSQNVLRSRFLPITSSPTKRWQQFDEREDQLLSSDQIKAYREVQSFSIINNKPADGGDSIENSSQMTSKIAEKVIQQLEFKRNKEAHWSKIQRSPVQGIDRTGVMITVGAIALLINVICSVQLYTVRTKTNALIADKASMDDSLESILKRVFPRSCS